MMPGGISIASNSGAFVAGAAARALEPGDLPPTPPASRTAPSPAHPPLEEKATQKNHNFGPDTLRMQQQSSKDSLLPGAASFLAEPSPMLSRGKGIGSKLPEPPAPAKLDFALEDAAPLGDSTLVAKEPAKESTTENIPPGQPNPDLDSVQTLADEPDHDFARPKPSSTPKRPCTPAFVSAASLLPSTRAPSHSSQEPKPEGYWKIHVGTRPFLLAVGMCLSSLLLFTLVLFVSAAGVYWCTAYCPGLYTCSS